MPQYVTSEPGAAGPAGDAVDAAAPSAGCATPGAAEVQIRGTARRQGRQPAARRLAWRLACVVAVVGLGQVLVATGVIPSSAVAEPSVIIQALGRLISTGSFWSSTGATAGSWAVGLAVSLCVAVPAGLLLGLSDLAYRMSRFTIDFLRTIPPVALIPLALLLYGATPAMALVLIIFGSVWPVLLQSMYGVHQVDPVTRDVARAYQFRRRETVFAVVLPSAAPFVATGVRIAATMSLLLAVGAELIGNAPGLGQSISVAEENGDIPQMYAYIVVCAVLGVLLNLALLRAERRTLRWHPAHRSLVAG
jgi:ABC-type nitrate/sulfonate/bicarbonate transport system permease component